MSIQNEIDRIIAAVHAAHEKVTKKGGTTTAPYLVANLESAIDTIPEGIDTSDATAVANDLPEGVTAYAKGEKITGNVKVLNSTEEIDNAPPVWNAEKESLQTSFYANGGRVLMEQNAQVALNIPGNKLGDATAADVAEGKTFTSENGLKQTGTKQDPVTVAQATPTISVSSAGLITASAAQAAGLVSAGTTSATKQLDVETWTITYDDSTTEDKAVVML